MYEEERVKALEDELKVLKNQIHCALTAVEERNLIQRHPPLEEKACPTAEIAWTDPRSEKEDGNHTSRRVEPSLPAEILRRVFSSESARSHGTEVSLSPVSPGATPAFFDSACQRGPAGSPPAESVGQPLLPVLDEAVDIAEEREPPEDTSDLPQTRQVSLEEVRDWLAIKNHLDQPVPPAPELTGASLEVPRSSAESHSSKTRGIGQTYEGSPGPTERQPSPQVEAARPTLAGPLTRPEGQLAVQSNCRIGCAALSELLEWVDESVGKIGAHGTRKALET